MDLLQQHFSGFIILLILGLRHGLDPDHITIIDGYTFQLHEKKSLLSKWVGTLFAFGHGLMVTVIALMLSLLKDTFEVPLTMSIVIEWIPCAMLLMIGIINLISFNKGKHIKTKSFRKWLIPKKFQSNLNPFTVVLTGIIFGFIFDTSTQIAAFGYTLSASDQWLFAVIGGLVFSVGLMTTGTFDSFLLSKLLKSFDQKKIKSHRFKLNVLITIMCFVIPIYKVSCLFNEGIKLNDLEINIVGICFIVLIIALYTELYFKHKKEELSKANFN